MSGQGSRECWPVQPDVGLSRCTSAGGGEACSTSSPGLIAAVCAKTSALMAVLATTNTLSGSDKDAVENFALNWDNQRDSAVSWPELHSFWFFCL